MANPRPFYVVGNLAEFLGITAGKTNGTPVAILTFRPHVTSPQQVNLMISRAQLMRLQEDIDALLAHSAILKDGDSPEVTLVLCQPLKLGLNCICTTDFQSVGGNLCRRTGSPSYPKIEP